MGQGPISAVITTSATPGSPEHASLIRRLRTSDSSKPQRLWLHLLHDSGGPPTSPNAYLNTARLFAPSKNVVLFPANITTSPVHVSLLQDRMQDRPILLTPRAPSSFPPFSPAPIALSRDYPVWCSERFFYGGDRLADWKECLWHIWLNQFGDVDFLNVTSVAPVVRGISPADVRSCGLCCISLADVRSSARYVRGWSLALGRKLAIYSPSST